jgi:hypothetical protein
MVGIFFFFLAVLGFELRASRLFGEYSTTWATPPAFFYIGYFWDRVLWTICLGCLQTTILLIADSRIARIIGMSHLRVATGVYSLCPHSGRGNSLLLGFFNKGTDSSHDCRALPPNAPHLNTITLVVGILTHEFWRDTNIQTTVGVYSILALLYSFIIHLHY